MTLWVKSAGLNGAVSLPVCPDQLTMSEPKPNFAIGPEADSVQRKKSCRYVVMVALRTAFCVS
jgi:hypothetical protein